MTDRTVGRAAAGMGVAAATSRVLGGVRVLVVAAVLGTTYLGNTFEAANSFPTVVFELLAAGALSAVLVPRFVELFDRGEQEEAERQAGGLLGLVLLVLGTLAVAGAVFAPQIARLLTSAVDDPEVAADQRELATFLLRFFMPQLVLYAVGFLAIALLHARRVFALPAAAPIGNTVVLVAALVVFRLMAGADPGLDLSTAEQVVLGLGGTLGVAAFIGIPAVALRRTGFRLRPRLAPREPAVRRLLRLSGWAVLQHTGAALLLGAAIVLGGAVEGGVVAYRVAFYVFLAPYGIIAQPIHTAIQPELALDAAAGDQAAFGRAMRWAFDSLAVWVLPVTAALVALAQPLVQVVAFGQADTADGVALMAAGVSSLALGLLAYGLFRLLAAAWYALDDSRTPAIAAVASALAGVGFMAAVAPQVDGAAKVFVLGLGHSAAFALGAIGLLVALRRRLGQPLLPRALPGSLVLAGGLGALAWLVVRSLEPDGRVATGLLLTVVGLAGGALYWLGVTRLHLVPEDVPLRSPA